MVGGSTETPQVDEPRSGRSLARRIAGHGAVGLGVAALLGNVFGLVFTVVVARALSPAGYGSLAALVSAYLIASIAGSALQITVAREVSLEDRRHDSHLAQHVRSWIGTVTVAVAAAAVVGVLLREPMASLIGVDEDPWAAAMVLPTGAAWLLLCVVRGVMQGLGEYRLVAGSIVGEAIARLALAVALIAVGLDVGGAFLASGLSIVAMAAILAVPMRRSLTLPAGSDAEAAADLARPADEHVADDWRLSRMTARTWQALVALSLFALLQNTDVIMVKRAADDLAAGAYAADAVAAKVIIWIAIGLGMYVVPEVARAALPSGKRRVLFRAVGLVALAGGMMVAVYAVAGEQLLAAAFGDEFAVESAALPLLGAAMVLLSVAYLTGQYFLAVKSTTFLALLALAAIVQLGVLSQVADSPDDTAAAMLAVQAALAATMFTASMLIPKSPTETINDQ